jgi:hypothetical protein
VQCPGDKAELDGPNRIIKTKSDNKIYVIERETFDCALNVRDQVSHSYTTTGKIIVFYILIFMVLDSRREGKMFWTEW